MNKRLLLFLVLVTLGLVAWWLSRGTGTTTLDEPLSDFMVPDTSKVDRIFIAQTDGKTADLRRGPDGWTVNGSFKAKQFDVNLLLRTFLRVEVRSPVPKSAEANVLRVMGTSSKRVEIYTGGSKPEKVWIVGHGTKDHYGTYMLLEKPGVGRSSAPFILGMSGFTGTLSSRFHADLDTWRSTNIFLFPDLYELAALEVDRPGIAGSGYRIEQTKDRKYRLTDLEGRTLPMDTVLAKGSLLLFTEINYEYIDRSLKPAQRDSLLASPPNHRIKVTHRDGTEQRASFWYKRFEDPGMEYTGPEILHDKTRMYALVEDTLLVTVQRNLFDRVLQPASALRP